MKTSSMALAVLAAASLWVFPVAESDAASAITAFGLTNRPINSATLVVSEEDREVRAMGLASLGYRGLRVQLGQAESGLYFSPFTRVPIEDGYFMSGHAYGRSAGLERRLSSVYCERKEWATFPIYIDFLPLGTLSKTVLVFVDDTFAGEETYTNGVITVSSSNSDSLGPRVNPLWRAPDGSVGVLIEFTQSAPPVYLPSGRYTYANRLFVRANHPLFDVDYVSRVDIYGGGGLSEFSGRDELLGMFGRPHRGLGGAVFTARKDKLVVGHCVDAGTDGVLAELRNSPAFEMELRPVSLTTNGARLQFSATGTWVGYYPFPSAPFLGPLIVENWDGEKRLRMDAPGTNARPVQVTVFDGAVKAGEFTVTSTEFIGNLGTNGLEMVSVGAVGGGESRPAALAVRFRRPVTLSSGPFSLRGDSVQVAPVVASENPATFASFQVLAGGIAPFTIVKETALATPPVTLDIERIGTNLVVSFPGFASPYSYLETSEALGQGGLSWHWTGGELLPYDGARVRTVLPSGRRSTGFFRMANYSAQIIDPRLSD